MVVLVRGAGEDAVDAGPDHLREGVLGEVGVAGVVQGVGEGAGETDTFVELADGRQPGVAGALARRRRADERRAEKVEDLRPDTGYTPRYLRGSEPVVRVFQCRS